MAFIADFIPLYTLAATAFIYLAIFIHFVYAKSMADRLKFIVVVAGFFAINAYVDFLLAQFFVVVWVVVTGTPMLLDKTTALVLLAIAALLPADNALFTVISLALYAIILGGFVLGAFKKVTGGK